MSRILVVDDEPDLRFILRRIFEKAGHEVADAGDGAAALECVRRSRPELVVMDPPRAGVGAEVCALLVRVSAPTVVYVSCDPVSLARD